MTPGQPMKLFHIHQSLYAFYFAFGVTLKMADISTIEAALKKTLQCFGVSCLKPEQRQILDGLMERKDCLVILPTGFGKSLPFQIFLPVMREINADFQNKVILVCCPLIALMQDQVSKLSTIPNVSAAYKGSSAESDARILNGEIDIIYASPEALINDAGWREDMKKLRVCSIVIDEFHTIATWGEDPSGQNKQAFRKWFASVGELRSLFPQANVVALSATCTQKIKKRVTKKLSLGPNTVEIFKSPNKSNIKLSVCKVSNELEIAMSWLVDGLKYLRDDFPKTLLYCYSINDVSKIYSYFAKELEGACSSLIEMFHSETPPSKKEEIVKFLGDTTNRSKIRLVICTNALGMGIDVSDCCSVILFGMPDNVVDLVQEIGRIGRNGEQSIALILFNSYHLRRLNKGMKEILCSNNCRRLNIMKQFLTDSDLKTLEKATGIHTCCDICQKVCKCEHCELLLLERLAENEVLSDTDSSENSEKTEDYWGSSDDDYYANAPELNFNLQI